MSARRTNAFGQEETKYCLHDREGNMILRYNRDTYDLSATRERSHSFPVMKLAVITEGSAEWRFIGTVCRTSPGDIVILRPNTLRKIENIDGDHVCCDMFSFTPPALSTADRCVELFYESSSAGHNVLPGTDESAPFVRRLLGMAADELRRDEPFSCDMALSLLTQAVVMICRAFGMRTSGEYHTVSTYALENNEKEKYDREDISSHRRENESVGFIIADTTDYIKRSCENSIDINALAERANMSRSTFFRHFRQQTGTTVNRYIQQCRVERVIEKMSEKRGSILDTAMSCGFNSGSAFYSAFRSVTGLSPHEMLAPESPGGTNEDDGSAGGAP